MRNNASREDGTLSVPPYAAFASNAGFGEAKQTPRRQEGGKVARGAIKHPPVPPSRTFSCLSPLGRKEGGTHSMHPSATFLKERSL